MAEQDPFSDENVEEVNGFIREDVLVQAKVECVEQRERVYVHGCPQLSEGGRKRGRRRKRGEQEVDDDPGGIGAYDGHGFAPSLKQRHDARHGPLVRADATAHKADSHTARDKHEEYDVQVAEAFAVKDIDAGQVAQERQHATDVYGIDMGQGFQHEAEDDAEDEDQQLDFTRLDGAHFAAALLDERGEVRSGDERFASLYDIDRRHRQCVVYQIDECCLIGIVPEVDGLVRPLEHHPESPDEGFRGVQEHELRGRRRKESHHDDGGRHAGLGVELERLDNAYCDGAEDDDAGEDGRKNDDEHKPGEEESRHKAVEGAARQLETSQGQPLGQPRLFHAFTKMMTAAKLSHGSTVAHGPNTTSASATPQRI